MGMKCPNCQKIFEPNTSTGHRLEAALRQKRRLIIVECPLCFKNISLNFQDPPFGEPQKISPAEYRICPVCTGVISYVDNGEEKFWGCGECGNVWFSQDDLDRGRLKKK